MDLARPATRRRVARAVALAVSVVIATAVSPAAPAASARPTAPRPTAPRTTAPRTTAPRTAAPRPGGLTPAQLRAQARTGYRPAAVAAGYVGCGSATVHCKPGLSGSCTGYSSQTTPPATIRVLVHASSTRTSIQTVPFETYVENVLPNEWIAGWDGDSLKAGAVAVKSYAWYWVTHYGGYVGATATATSCFDVTDDTSFQVYRANSVQARTTSAVLQTWPYVLRQNGQVFQAGYAAFLSSSTESCGYHANGYTLSQWGSQNCVEASTGNKFPVILAAYYRGTQLATAQQLATAHDFVYRQSSTRVAYDPATGHWYIDDGYPTTFKFGVPGDIPVVTTTGDGFAHAGIFRPSTGTWAIANPAGHTAALVPFGIAGDIPVAAQYNGADQPTQVAVWRPSNGVWYLATPTAHVGSRIVFGHRGDVPVPGHYTGGADEIAYWHPADGTWHLYDGRVITWGRAGDIPVPADYDGNGTTDIAVYRPSTHQFLIQGRAPQGWGTVGDIPVTGDFTGDGKADLVMYRPSNQRWYVFGHGSVAWGPAGATPIGKAPYSD